QQKKINGLEIIIRHTKNINDLSNCQMIFITRSVIGNLDDIIMLSHERPILTVADTPGTASQGIMLNMAVKEGKITFEANIITAKNSGLRLSSQLLRFASKVYQ
ncbi:YfiR family protein, partial [Nitrosococcus oceani]|uniref:YfiR family protein n=1 Tax=Nitrosococcus oceani TaxID=1229 RepID=UPI0004E86B61